MQIIWMNGTWHVCHIDQTLALSNAQWQYCVMNGNGVCPFAICLLLVECIYHYGHMKFCQVLAFRHC